MGRNKALLEFQGETLAERGLRKLGEVCSEVAIAGGVSELGRFGRVIPDQHSECGPLGGIVAALQQSSHEWNLFLAVDMPFVPVEALRTLLSSVGDGLCGVVSQVDGQLHPLCGVYSKTALPILRRELEAGRFKMKDAVEAAGQFVFLRFHELNWFRNLNTPNDLAAAQAFDDESLPADRAVSGVPASDRVGV